MVKTCNKCKEEKPYSEFSKDKIRKDGYRYECKSCLKAYYEVNKDKKKAYREANKDKRKSYAKTYRAANKEWIKEKDKTYYEANKDKIIARISAYANKRRKTDALYRLKINLRTRTYQAFRNKGYSKNTKTQ